MSYYIKKIIKEVIRIMIIQLLSGCIMIYVSDKILKALSAADIYVGINPVTMMISAILGIPGTVTMFLVSVVFQGK